MTVAAGSQLGPYEILGPLGAGGMGEVLLAVVPEVVASEQPMTVVLNWMADRP